MKEHAAKGSVMVHKVLKDTDDEQLHVIAEMIAQFHHARWDGKGYPDGLKGEEIPQEARIMAVADVYDALVSKRVYKERMPFEKADQIMMEGMGNYHTEVLLRDNKIYTQAWFDDDNDRGAKMTEGTPGLNYLNLSDEFIKESKLKELGEEEVFGKTCKVYTYKTKSLLRTITNTVWVWQGIILKMETKGALGANNSMMVKEFVENPKLPASTFAIPEKVI